jgi:hypothetical protein
MATNRERVPDKITERLQQSFKLGAYKDAAVNCAKCAKIIVATDPRIAGLQLDWLHLQNPIFSYMYTAILIQELHGAGSWANVHWLIKIIEGMREELIPRLLKYKGRVNFQFKAGFQGIKGKSTKPRKRRKRRTKAAHASD